jgi:hypothetical protein
LQLVPDHDPDNNEELAGLRTGFPQFRIWREISCDRTRYIARSLQPGTRPHTIVTADPRELRAALDVGMARARPDLGRVFESRMPNIARVGWLVGLDTLDVGATTEGTTREGTTRESATREGATRESTTWESAGWPGQLDLRRADSGTGRPPRRTTAVRRGPGRPNPTVPQARADSPADGPRQWKESPEDVRCWQEAARLRHEHPGWVVLWLARIRQYRAYRLRGRRDTVLTASTPADLAAQISRSEGEAPGRLPRPRRPT